MGVACLCECMRVEVCECMHVWMTYKGSKPPVCSYDYAVKIGIRRQQDYRTLLDDSKSTYLANHVKFRDRVELDTTQRVNLLAYVVFIAGTCNMESIFQKFYFN